METERCGGRGAAAEVGQWLVWLEDHPSLLSFETPSLPVHKIAAAGAA